MYWVSTSTQCSVTLIVAGKMIACIVYIGTIMYSTNKVSTYYQFNIQVRPRSWMPLISQQLQKLKPNGYISLIHFNLEKQAKNWSKKRNENTSNKVAIDMTKSELLSFVYIHQCQCQMLYEISFYSKSHLGTQQYTRKWMNVSKETIQNYNISQKIFYYP